MKYVVKKYIVTAFSLFILSQIIPAFSIQGGWYGLFYASFVLGLFFYIFRPVLNILLFPLNLLTLNLASWIIQIVIFYVWTVVISQVRITGWLFPGINLGPITLSPGNLVKWQVIIVLAAVFILITKILDWILK